MLPTTEARITSSSVDEAREFTSFALIWNQEPRCLIFSQASVGSDRELGILNHSASGLWLSALTYFRAMSASS